MVLHQNGECRWEGVELHPYKEDGTIFRDVTRQTLAKGTCNLPVELRYFEVGVGGHSTLERHEHSHLVTIVRGSGQVLVGDEVHEIGDLDVVQIPPMTWHQFQATSGEVLGFLCVVSEERDRPQRPGPEELDELNQNERVEQFIKV
jgi:quercetin dioxygenase-like cupin family protein